MSCNNNTDLNAEEKDMLRFFYDTNHHIKGLHREIEAWEIDLNVFEPETQRCAVSIRASDRYPIVVLRGANDAELCLSEMMLCKNIILAGAWLLLDCVQEIEC